MSGREGRSDLSWNSHGSLILSNKERMQRLRAIISAVKWKYGKERRGKDGEMGEGGDRSESNLTKSEKKRIREIARVEEKALLACVEGDIETLKSIIPSLPDPFYEDSRIFRAACENGRKEIVNYLLNLRIGGEKGGSRKSRRVNVNAKNDSALRKACKHGHTEVVRSLLLHGADPQVESNYPIRIATQNNHHEIVRLLLQYDVSLDIALIHASEIGDVESLKMFLRDPRADPTVFNNYPLQIAVINENIEAVKLLLLDIRVDARADNDYALKIAMGNGNKELCDLIRGKR